MLLFAALFAVHADAPRIAVVVDAPAETVLPEEPRARIELVRLEQPLDQEKKSLEQARKEAKRGSDAALALEMKNATGHYEEALELYARAMPILADLDEVARCLFDLGAAQVDAKAADKAAESFRRALVLNPAVRADRVRHNPDVVRTFEKVLKQHERSKRGSLTLTGEPKGADVYMDGKRVGTLPASLSALHAGEHWLSVRAPGRLPFSARFAIEERKVAKLEVFLVERETRTLVDRVAELLASDAVADASELTRFAAERKAKVVALVQARSGQFNVRFFDTEREWLSVRGREATVAAALAWIEKTLAGAPTEEPVRPSASPAAAALGTATTLPAQKAKTREIRVHPALALLPLGIGQFLEERTAPGVLLVVSQVLLLATNLTAYFVAQRFAAPGGTFRQPQTVEALKWVVNVSFGLVIADVIAGGIDGIVYRNRTVEAP